MHGAFVLQRLLIGVHLFIQRCLALLRSGVVVVVGVVASSLESGSRSLLIALPSNTITPERMASNQAIGHAIRWQAWKRMSASYNVVSSAIASEQDGVLHA